MTEFVFMLTHSDRTVPNARAVYDEVRDCDLRYVGFTIPPDFVVGYGLDVGERYRNLSAVYQYTGPLST